MPDLQGIKKAKGKGKKKNPGPQDFKKQKVKVGRKVSAAGPPTDRERGAAWGSGRAGLSRRRHGPGAQRACVRGRAGGTDAPWWRARRGQLVKKNETSTTIKSRKLNLQKQSVAVDRTGKEVNSRGLTLVEILSHSTHYNANMRKECLAGIRDFFDLHPALLSLHVGAVRRACPAAACINPKPGAPPPPCVCARSASAAPAPDTCALRTPGRCWKRCPT